MRSLTIAGLLLIGMTAVSTAQTVPVPPQGDRPITRAEFIQRATDRAASHAAAVFDQVDTARSGAITRSQLRTWRQQHRGGGMGVR